MATTYDPTADPIADKDIVRLLLNDVGAPWVFQDEEITGFLTLEAGSVKRAAAQAIDTNADNELLASKIITTQNTSTKGDSLADSLRKRAAALREQAVFDEENSDDGFYFDLVDIDPLVVTDPDFPDRQYLI